MPTVYKVAGKNVGKDVSVTISDSLGNQFNAAQLGIMTHFEVEADYDMNETKSIINGGQSFFESLPQGAKVTIKLARSNGALEQLEAAYRRASRNGIQVNYTLQYQTVNRDSSINTHQLRGGKPHNWKLGAYGAGAGEVTQSVEFVFGELDDNGERQLALNG